MLKKREILRKDKKTDSTHESDEALQQQPGHRAKPGKGPRYNYLLLSEFIRKPGLPEPEIGELPSRPFRQSPTTICLAVKSSGAGIVKAEFHNNIN